LARINFLHELVMAGLYDNYVKTDNIFKGAAPSIGGYDWGSAGGGGGGTDWGQTPGVDWGGSLNLPGLSGTGALASGSGSGQPSWLGAAINALDKALGYKKQNSTSGLPSSSREERGYGSSVPAATRGKGYTLYLGAPEQKTTQTGGSSGIGGAIGTLAGAGIGFIAGGPAGAGLGATLGGAGGSLFG
jgi:hypothetical protein